MLKSPEGVTLSRRRRWLLAIAPVAGLLLGCGGEIDALDEVGESQSQLIGLNGLDENGLKGNGLNGNGLNSNGLNSNGLNGNGLNGNGFKGWFNQTDADGNGTIDVTDRDLHGAVMGYLIGCACSSGTTRTFTDSAGKKYTWSGNLGLATSWCAGSAASTSERERVTACLAAHVNTRGLKVTISLAGLGIARDSIETELWSLSEAQWFGELWKVSSSKTDRSKTFSCRNYDYDRHNIAYQKLGRSCGRSASWGDCQVTVPLEECVANSVCSQNQDRTASSCRGEGSSYANVLSTFLPQRMELGDAYNSADGYYRRCDDQHWGSGGCSPNPLKASRSSNARWDVLTNTASENYAGEPGVGDYTYRAATFDDAASSSWMKLPNHLKTTGTRTLNILYLSPGKDCQLNVSVNNGASYSTVTFKNTYSSANFQRATFSFNFTSTSPTIVLSTVGRGACSPMIDWLYISK